MTEKIIDLDAKHQHKQTDTCSFVFLRFINNSALSLFELCVCSLLFLIVCA